MTEFEKAYAQAQEGKLKTPKVIFGGAEVSYFRYQLAVHKMYLNLMAKGIKSKGVKLKDLKAYYGLKGRTAKDCLPQFEAIFEKY